VKRLDYYQDARYVRENYSLYLHFLIIIDKKLDMFKTLHTFRYGLYYEIESKLNISAVNFLTNWKQRVRRSVNQKNTRIYSPYVAYNFKGKICSDTESSRRHETLTGLMAEELAG